MKQIGKPEEIAGIALDLASPAGSFATGRGDGPAAAGMEPKPTNLTDKALMVKYSDKHIAEALKKGGAAVGKSPLMSAFGDSMSDADISDAVAFVRSLAK